MQIRHRLDIRFSVIEPEAFYCCQKFHSPHIQSDSQFIVIKARVIQQSVLMLEQRGGDKNISAACRSVS